MPTMCEISFAVAGPWIWVTAFSISLSDTFGGLPAIIYKKWSKRKSTHVLNKKYGTIRTCVDTYLYEEVNGVDMAQRTSSLLAEIEGTTPARTGRRALGRNPSMSKHSQPEKDADESSINSLWVCVDCLLPLFGAAIAGRHCHGTGCTVVRLR